MIKIKAVIFDIDGTLINRREAFLRFCDYLIDKYSEQYPYVGTKADLIDYMIEIDENGYGGIRSFIPRLSKLWKLPLSIEEFINERNEIFGKLSTPLPDLYEVLDYLKDKYKLGIITNGYSTVQRDKIKAVGIEHYFDNILVSGDGSLAKPDPRIFQLSCEYLEIRPEEAVYVGDYFPNDIVGSIGANIMPIWIDEGLDEHLEYDGIKITGLRALLDYL